MPDYSIIQNLCDTLHTTLAQLMDGEDADSSVRVYDDNQILDLLRRTKELEKQRRVQSGFILIILGIASNAMAVTIGGSNVKDFLSGLLLGLSIIEMIAGMVVALKNQNK